MASCENKYITLLDLSRQAKVITGETACFDGKIQAGIPFSGYPTGVDTGTTVSLGISFGGTETSVFSGNTGTTVFDVSNSGSTNYDSLFSGYSGTVWTNTLFSGNTSGLTLPITPFSAETQIVGPIWTLTQTGMTGDYVIGTQYTGYSITYSFSEIAPLPITAYTAYSGFCSATQENFSAGTLDYKGPLDYISTKEDATVEGILTTKKLTVTDGASASTIGYVLTQLDSSGRAGWAFNSASASTNTFVTGGTLNGTNLDLTWNTGGSVPSIDFSSLSGLTFTGNTSGDCITDLWLTNLYGCSPLHIEPSGVNNVYIVENGGNVGIGTTGTTEKLHVSGGDILVENDSGKFYSDLGFSSGAAVRLSGSPSDLTTFGVNTSGFSGNEGIAIGVRGLSESSFPGYGKQGDGFLYSSVEQNGVNIISPQGTNKDDYIRFYAGQDANGTTPDIHIQGTGSTRGYVAIGHDTPTEKLHVEGSIKMVDGNESNGYVLTSDANGVGSWVASAGGGTFTGNTSGSCITDLYVSTVYGCSGGGQLNLRDGSDDTWSITSDNGLYASDSAWVYGKSSNGTQLGYQLTTFGEAIGFGVFASGSNPLLGTANDVTIHDNVITIPNSGNLDKRAVFVGSKNSTIFSGVTNTVVIGGQNITGTTDDTVYVPNLNIGTLSIVTTGTTIIDNLGIESSGLVVKSYTTKRLEIGDWDMTATTQVNVAHGLSATEWKTMLESNVLIRNDSDTVYAPLKSLNLPSTGLMNGGVSVIDSTNITLGRYTTGGFDDGAFTSTSYNRGWVTFDYIKD